MNYRIIMMTLHRFVWSSVIRTYHTSIFHCYLSFPLGTQLTWATTWNAEEWGYCNADKFEKILEKCIKIIATKICETAFTIKRQQIKKSTMYLTKHKVGLRCGLTILLLYVFEDISYRTNKAAELNQCHKQE